MAMIVSASGIMAMIVSAVGGKTVRQHLIRICLSFSYMHQ